MCYQEYTLHITFLILILEILGELLEGVCQFVSDFTNHMKSVTVLYTRTKNNRYNSAMTSLMKLKQETPKETQLYSFLDHLIGVVNAQKDKVIVDPLSPEKRLKLVEVIRDSEVISNNSSNAFELVLPFESKTKLVFNQILSF